MVEDANDLILGSDGNWRILDLFTGDPEFVVHPPLGKWTIAVGEQLFGATPFGWRFAVAVLGTLMILMTARIARRLTRSDLVGTLAGLLLAVEGMHLVMSRSGLLDMVLAFWVLAAFGLLLIDRDRTRGRLADLVRRDGLAAVSTDLGASPRAAPLALGRRPGPRPRLQREVVGPVVPGLLHPHVPRVGRLHQEGDRRAPPLAGDDPPRRAGSRPLDGRDRRRRLPHVLDGLVRHRRRLRPAVGRGPPGVVRSRGAAVAVALPRGGVAVPRQPELPPSVRQQRPVLVPAGPSHVLLLRERRGGLLQREMRIRGDRPGEPAHLVVRDPRRDPPAVALDRAAGLAIGRCPRGHRRRLGAVAALPRPHDLHLLRRGVRALRGHGRRDDAGHDHRAGGRARAASARRGRRRHRDRPGRS